MENKKNVVLVPTDFTEVADYAIRHGAGICKQQNQKLILLHVINKDTKSYLKKEKLSGMVINERLDKKAREISQEYQIDVDFIAREGSIFTMIPEIAAEVGASIITMGTHGKVGVQKLVGSYALKVIEKSPVPVIVVQKRDFRGGYRNIILPIDDTSESKQKVKWAIHIARKFNSAVNIFAMYSSEAGRMARIKGNFNQIRKFFDQNGIKHTSKICENKGTFPKNVLSYAKEIDADVIMIMTNPDKLMPSFMVSKWEEQILFNDNHIPVMAINPIDFNIVVGGL